MAIFSGAGFIGRDPDFSKDGRGCSVLILAVCYTPKTSKRNASWVEIVAKGEMADRLSILKKDAVVEFHLNDLRLEQLVQGEQHQSKLTGRAISLRALT